MSNVFFAKQECPTRNLKSPVVSRRSKRPARPQRPSSRPYDRKKARETEESRIIKAGQMAKKAASSAKSPYSYNPYELYMLSATLEPLT